MPSTAAPASPPQPSVQPLTPIPDGGFTVQDVVAWLQSQGYSAKVVPDPDGDCHILTNIQGTDCNVFLNDAKDGRYQSIGFGVGFATNGKFDIAHVNEWNTNNRWTRVYYDNVNDPWIMMDVDLWPGGTYESLRDQFAAWNNTLARFIKKYDLK